jgi:hypothetical protein
MTKVPVRPELVEACPEPAEWGPLDNEGPSTIDPACKYYQRHTGERRYPVARIARPFNWIPGQARNDEVHTISWPDQ